MKRGVAFGVVASLALAGCAKQADQVQASYVSPIPYQGYTCAQIAAEGQRISSRVAQLTGAQNRQASNDAVATGVAIVLFWPAAFFIRGDSETAAELGRLKGEMDAIEQVSIQKNCGIVFQRPEPEKPDTREGHVVGSRGALKTR